MRLKKKMLGIILCLVLVLGLMPWMSLTTQASPVETLLTTVSFANDGSQTHSTDGVVTVTINASGYNTEKGWLFGSKSGDVTVTPVNGVEITKVRFIQNEKVPLDDDDAPFELSYTYNSHESYLSGATVGRSNGLMRNGAMDGVTSIEVYGYKTNSSDNTNTNTDTSEKVPYDDVPISTGFVKDITGTAAATAESNPFGTKIENNNNLPNLLSLTDAEVAQGVNVWLDIQDMSSSVPQTDKNLIQNTSGDYTVGLYLDINLFKKVGNNDATKVTETNGKVKASITIPESLWKSGRTFEIIRVHDGVATAIEGTYDEKTHVFTFETDKFSTYALAYKDPASSSDSGTTSKSSNSTQSTSPKTGDSNDIRVWYLFLIASLGGLGFLGLSKKKKVND